MNSLGKCMVKGCEREAMRASVAILPDKSAWPVVVCLYHFQAGTNRYKEQFGKKETKQS